MGYLGLIGDPETPGQASKMHYRVQFKFLDRVIGLHMFCHLSPPIVHSASLPCRYRLVQYLRVFEVLYSISVSQFALLGKRRSAGIERTVFIVSDMLSLNNIFS
jgi:hypothetical protein